MINSQPSCMTILCFLQNVKSKMATVSLGTVKKTLPLPSNFVGGYVGFGTGGFYNAQFDNFTISTGS